MLRFLVRADNLLSSHMKPNAVKADEWGAPVVGCRVRQRAWDSIHSITLYIFSVPAAPWGTFAESHYEPIL